MICKVTAKCVRVYVRACVRTCVRAYVRACVRMCVRMCVRATHIWQIIAPRGADALSIAVAVELERGGLAGWCRVGGASQDADP